MAGEREQHEGSRGWPEWPAISERHWEAATISAAIISVILFFFALGEIFLGQYSNAERKDLITLLAPFGAFAVAVVTFCSVNWRGKITTRQANVAERESRAKLLQEGAKLLGEEGRSHISAGIATLGVLVVGDDEPFAIEAMNLLADFLSATASENPDSGRTKHALAVLASGEKLGRRSTRTVYFFSADVVTGWPIVRGVEEVHYDGGRIDRQYHSPPYLPSNASFSRTKIVGFHDIVVDNRFSSCAFELCKIARVEQGWGRLLAFGKEWRTTFMACDFSDAVLQIALSEQDLLAGNHFYQGHPPRSPNGSPTVIPGVEEWSLSPNQTAAK